MNEKDQWSLEIKMIKYRKQIEAQSLQENLINQQISLIRQEKAQIYQSLKSNIIRNFSDSLPYTVPLSIFSSFLMKSLIIIPITLLTVPLFINKIPSIPKIKPNLSIFN